MRMLKQSVMMFSLLAITGLSACGDNGGDGGDTPDAAPLPDAPLTPAQLRTGVLAVLDTKLLIDNAGNDVVAAAGGVVSVAWSDNTLPSPDPAFEMSINALNGCMVTVFDVEAGVVERPIIDEGEVTITGTKLPVGTCAFSVEENDYACSLQSGAVPAGSLIVGSDGELTIAFAGGNDPFAGANIIGAHIQIDGIPAPDDAHNGVFPVINQSAGTVTYLNADIAGGPEVGDNVTYTILTGLRPVPVEIPGVQDGVADVATVDFVGDGTEADKLVIAKAQGDVLEPFSKDIFPSGEGFLLSSDSARPHAFPATAEALTFSCAAASGGVCGAPGVGITGLILDGRTTDAPVDANDITDMPPAQKKFATFRCTAVDSDTITLVTEGVQAILDTAPTRIETTIMSATADPAEPSAKVAGHAFLGYTTFPPSN